MFYHTRNPEEPYTGNPYTGDLRGTSGNWRSCFDS